MDVQTFARHLAEFPVDIDESFLLDQLQNRKRWPFHYMHTEQYGSLAVIDHRGNLMARQFVAQLYGYDGYLDYRNFIDLYQAGYTMQLIDVLDLDPTLRMIATTLRAKGLQATANIYMSHSDQGSPSFPPHDHPYDVAVKQLYGTSTWTVADQDHVLSANHTIAVPAGTVHAVVAHTCPRASLTINFG